MQIPPDIRLLAERLLKLADSMNAQIAAAESCTGGQLSAVLTSIEGLSHCFHSGMVGYSDDAKTMLLDVPGRLLDEEGAVSRAVAIAMAKGCLDRSKAKCTLAVTGFAGPGDRGDEPGLVHVAVAVRDSGTWHRELHFGAIDRDRVRWDSIRTTLDLAVHRLGQLCAEPLLCRPDQ